MKKKKLKKKLRQTYIAARFLIEHAKSTGPFGPGREALRLWDEHRPNVGGLL